MQSFITFPELESAINFWRQRSPSVGEKSYVFAQRRLASRRPMHS